MNNWHPFGKNILFSPIAKDKIIGDTSRFWLYGNVLDVGDEVKTIKKGDCIALTQWALNKVVMADKTESYFVKEDDDFLLGVLKNEA